MEYDESLFSRLDDGWYSEKANTMATVASEMDIYPGVQLPQRLNGGIFQISSNVKADWADISINNSTTADVQNSQINIDSGEILDMSITHQLVNFDTWYELRLIVDNNSSNLNFVSGNKTLPFIKEGNDYVVNLTSFNSKTLGFSINDGSVTIKNIIITSHTIKTGSGSTSLSINNINGLKQAFENQFDIMYPVGIVLEMDTNTDPNNTMRGTWERFAPGRVTVGLDPTQTEFNTLGKTGGAKEHTLTTVQIPSHTHLQNAHNHTQNAHNHGTITTSSNGNHSHGINYATTGASGTARPILNSNGSTSGTSIMSTAGAHTHNVSIGNTTATNQSTTSTNQNTGGGQAHNNLQPYVVVNKWVRTA